MHSKDVDSSSRETRAEQSPRFLLHKPPFSNRATAPLGRRLADHERQRNVSNGSIHPKVSNRSVSSIKLASSGRHNQTAILDVFLGVGSTIFGFWPEKALLPWPIVRAAKIEKSQTRPLTGNARYFRRDARDAVLLRVRAVGHSAFTADSCSAKIFRIAGSIPIGMPSTELRLQTPPTNSI